MWLRVGTAFWFYYVYINLSTQDRGRNYKANDDWQKVPDAPYSFSFMTMTFKPFAPVGMRCVEKRVQRIEYLVEVRLLLFVRSKDWAKQRLKLFGLAITFDLFKQVEESEALLHAYVKPAPLQFGNQIVERQADLGVENGHYPETAVGAWRCITSRSSLVFASTE